MEPLNTHSRDYMAKEAIHFMARLKNKIPKQHNNNNHHIKGTLLVS